MKLKGKVFVVTGGGSGMGRELVIQLIKKGVRAVAIADINETGMKETAQIAGEHKVSTHLLNVIDKTAVENLPAQIIETHGQIDGIINNAGIIHPFKKINDLDYCDMERVMNINFFGTLYMCKSFLPHLLERPEAHIVNISSMGGFIPFPGQTFYSASKAAVKLLTEGMYAELRNTGVHTTIIHPGAIKTNISTNSNVAIDQKADKKTKRKSIPTMAADQAVKRMINAIENNKYRVLIGSDARLLDFLYRLTPRYAVHFIIRKMGALMAN